MTARSPAPVALAGRYVVLEPLRLDHVPDLYMAQRGLETDWGWLPVLAPRSEAEMRLIVEQRLAQQAAGGAFLFTVLQAGTRRPVGWIAYLDICVLDQRLDVGWYWLGASLSGTFAAVEIHLLLMQHAFHLGFSRVQWQFDDLDRTSHNTMMQINAVREGLLRRHVRRPDGSWRDTVVYSVLAPKRSAPVGGFAPPALPAPTPPRQVPAALPPPRQVPAAAAPPRQVPAATPAPVRWPAAGATGMGRPRAGLGPGGVRRRP